MTLSETPGPSALRRPFVVLIVLAVITCLALFGLRAFLIEYAQPIVHPTSDPAGAPDSPPPTPAEAYPFIPKPTGGLFMQTVT